MMIMNIWCVEFDGEACNFNAVFSTFERARAYVLKIASSARVWKNFAPVEDEGERLYGWYNTYCECEEYCMITERELDREIGLKDFNLIPTND